MKYSKTTFKLPTFLPASPNVPFLRRFTDERATDLADTQALYASVSQRFETSPWSAPDIIERFNGAVAEAVAGAVTIPPYEPFAQALDRCQTDILSLENALFKRAIINDWHLSLKEQIDLRRFLRAKEHFLANADRVAQLLFETIASLTAHIIEAVPDLSASPFTVPLHTLLDLNDTVDRIIGTFSREGLADAGLFTHLTDTLYRNICRASGFQPYTEHSRPFVTPAESPLRGDELLDAYLANTPFIDLFRTDVPFHIPPKAYREHGAIFAPTGHGKTQALQAIIMGFLNDPDPPAMFIMDSMGAMLRKIERLDLFAASDKLVILDPTDEHPPALNFFKLRGGSPAQQMGLFFYLFKAIEQGLTQRQATMVAYLVQLMQEIDGATLDTLRQVCEDRTPRYTAQLDRLEPIARDFFKNQFYGKDPLINQTKQQIAARLYTVGRSQAFNRMFSARDNKFDAFECMQEKKVVLINTDRLYLGDEASAIFGRYIIAQCLAAALSRATTPERDRHLAILIVDEAKAYLDDQAEKILSDARQFGLGMLLATQAPHQLPDGVQRELATNTSIKIVGPVSYSVASTLSRDMRTSPEFIQEMRSVDRSHAEFACYVRNLTPRAIKLSIPLGVLENEYAMDDDDFTALRARNRARYGIDPPAPTIPNSPAKATERQPPLNKPIVQPPHKEVTVEQPQTSTKKPKQPQTSPPVTELDTDH